MGFTKKSLLALVLALVMVLGMAMPTAFAATVAGMNFYSAATRVAGMLVGADGTTSYPMLADGGSYTIWMANTETVGASSRLYIKPGGTTSNIAGSGTKSGDAVNFEILNLDSTGLTVTTDGTAGTLTLKPTGKAFGSDSFTVRASAPDNEWRGADGEPVPDTIYEAEFFYTITPIIKYIGDPIIFDVTSPLNQSISLDGSKFESTSGAPVKLTNVVGMPGLVPSAGASVLGTGDVDNCTYWVTRTAATVTSGTLTVKKATVSGVPAADLVIPFGVGDSKNDAIGYKIGADKTSLTFKANAKAADRTINVFPANMSGTAIASSTLSGIAAPVAGAATAGSGNPTVTISGNALVVDVPTTIISGKWTVTVSGDVAGTVLVPLQIPITIEPVPLTADATSLRFDVNRATIAAASATGPNTQDVIFSTPNGMMTLVSQTGLTAGWWTSLTASQCRIRVPAGTAPTTGTASFTGTVDGYTTETVKIPYTIVDNTPKPKFEPDIKQISLDTRTGTPSQVVAFGVDTNWTGTRGSTGGAGTQPAITVTDKGGKAVAAADVSKYFTYSWVLTPKDKIALTITSVGPVFEGTITIKGTCATGTFPNVYIPFEPVTLNVNIVNTLPGVPNKIEVNPASITGDVLKVVNNTFTVKDFSGTALSSTLLRTGNIGGAPQLEMFAADGSTLTASDYVTLAAVGSTGEYNITLKKPISGATLKIWAWTGAANSVANKTVDGIYLDVPVTINGLKLTTDTTSLIVFDRANEADTKTIKVTLPGNVTFSTVPQWSTSPAAGGLAHGAQVSLNGTPVSAIQESSSTATEKTYKISLNTGATGGNTSNPNKLDAGKLILSGGQIEGVPVDDLVFNYRIGNSVSLVPDKTEFKFSMASGGVKEAVLTITPNPSAGNVDGLTVKAVDSSIVSVTKQIANPMKFDLKALKPGKTLITIDGTVNGITVEQAVVEVTVEGDELPVLVVTPNPIALDLTTNKEVTLAVTSSVAGKTVTDAKITYTGALVTVDGLKVTAALAGTGSLTVDGKIDGIAAATVTVPITVTEAPVITGDFLVNGAPGTAGSLFVRNSVANNQYKLTLNGYTGSVTWKSSNKAILKFIDAPAGKASSTKTGTEVQWVQVLKAGTVKVTATPATGTAKSISFTIKAEAETGFTVGDQALLVGQRASAKPEIVPATAKTKGFKFKSSDKKVVTVSSKGILVAKKAGTATITVTPKKKGLAKQTFTVTVTVDYKNLNYNSVVLLQNSDGKPNADADNVKKIFESARFDASGNAAGANILAATATKADVKAAIATMALASKNTSDISNFYFAGAATKTGLTFTDGEYSYTDLANDLAKCTGNVVVFLDCTGGNRLINAKAASDADIFAAFSKAVKPGLSTMTNSAVEKLSFTVFTSTAKAKTTVTPTVSADGSSVQYKFTKLFAETLKVSDSNTISVGTNGIVNVKQLWAKLKAAKGSVWASKKSVMPIYGYVPAAPVTP